MRKYLLLLVASLLFAAAACGPTATPAPTSAPVPTTAPAVATTAPAAPTTAPAAPTTAATAAAVAPATAVPTTAAPAATKTVLRIPESSKIPQTIDPGITSGGGGLEQVQNFFEGLIVVDQVSGQIVPGQAEKWTISPDGLTYTFNLRAGLKWSDGQPLTANDFVYAWKRQMDPATKSNYLGVLNPVKGAEAFANGKGTADGVGLKATDDRTFVVTLEQPAPFFLFLAATWSAYPVRKDMIDKYGDKWTASPQSYVGNGHYRMTEWKPEQSMSAEKNPNYWGENNGPDTVIWTLYASPNAQSLAAYEAGELDRAIITGPDLARAQTDPTLSKELKKFPRQQTNWIIFDTTSKPFDDVKVRQALTLAVDTKKLNEIVLKNAFYNAVAVVAPGVPGSKPENALGFDLTKAKQLLSDAGYPGGKGWPANLKISFDGSAPEFKASAEAVQAMWKDGLGIDVVLDPQETNAFFDFFNSLGKKPYNMQIGAWGSDYPDPNNWYNLLFDSKADFYHSHWKNAQFDTLINQGLSEGDPAKRTALYEQADKFLQNDAAFLPLFHGARFDVIKPYVTGLTHFSVLGRIQAYLVRIQPH